MPTIDMDNGVEVAPRSTAMCPIGRRLLGPQITSSDVLITQFTDEQSPVDSEAEYDTDMENEGSKDFEVKQLQTQLYRKVCRQFGVTPASYYLRHINDKVLVMKHQALGPKGTKALTVPLQVNTRIHSLDLQGNCMGAEGVRHVAFMLEENTSLKRLNLSYNRLRTSGIRIICRALHQNPHIKSVDLSGNGITDRDAKYLCELLEKTTALQRLNLSNNGLSEDGAVMLGKAIGINHTLISLNLSWNHIRLKGAEAIADGLKENNHLEELNLSMNGFSRNGTEFLAAALEVNTTLLKLDISSNRIEQAGCVAMAKALGQSSTLQYLAVSVIRTVWEQIGLNAMTFYGTLELIECVAKNENSNLEFIDMTSSIVSVAFMDVVEVIQKQRRFDVRVGHVTTSPSQRTTVPDVECNDKNPLEILLLFMSNKNLRLLDLFKSLDKDQSGSLTREEFIDGLQSVDSPLSKAQLDELINMLDKDGDGEIDLTEILNINREFKDVKRKVTRQIQEKKVRARLKSAVSMAGALSRIGSAISSASDGGSSIDVTKDHDIREDGPVYSNQLLVPGM
ncbi:hypothetical protein NP493_139g02012 [Ridgeia piscesae]|uniref:EF-hand domain-containing protein n=1 Tax=Ridgeia piscesae TaxID=27915 RepID=A0AAD9P574_RIDPI|nr:hypothetical protein NP493_139g02012 [Ridgeia piscesae]